MSFITKRERVFNEYDLFDLPARNEGKLKAYASCTDARAWSHFCSDQTEHLVDIIKRNNDTCRPKYVPTDVIVDTLMGAKNAEIGRLKHKIEEFEQMLAAYDQLDLTCEQKCEIANAHAAIKAANKELDDMFLDLDLSGFTEGMESDAFETGKSRGDELGTARVDAESGKFNGDGEGWVVEKEPPKVAENKSNQTTCQPSCRCDASTNATDPKIQEMQEALINKDAKLSAMHNTIAVMENDVCEPYCIYAHIYTALEKIFGILCQNDKYKLYLSLMTAGKDTRCIDIKGKILFKLKVLEKFSQALIAPCSQVGAAVAHAPSQQDCSCFRAEILQQMIPTPTYALTSAEVQQPSSDNRRAHLVADIMQNEEMKEILSKESFSTQNKDEHVEELIEDYDIETENLKRLKSLQENYDDLMTCYESLKHEKDELVIKCQKYEELDKEYMGLRNQLREYNLLWNEKEHYRKRSADLDSLKEKFIVLSDETTAMEAQLKAESEINKIKTNTIEELRIENVALEKKINDALIAFEKEKSLLMCKLQEAECKCMCQEQQIKSLSVQIDRLLEQEPEKNQTHSDPAQSLMLMDQIESLKEQINNLKDALCCNEEEKQSLHDEFQNNLKTINDLKLEIEEWKSGYEKIMHRNNYLEDYAQSSEDELNKLLNENNQLSQAVEEKTKAVGNLIEIIDNKSQEINKLLGEIEVKQNQNNDLRMQLHEFTDMYKSNMSAIENEKEEVLESLTLAKRESAELSNKLKDYDYLVQSQSDLQARIDNCNKLKKALSDTIEENKNLQIDLKNRDKSNTFLLNEIEKLQVTNTFAFNNIKDLDEERNKYKASLELTLKKSEMLENKLTNFESLSLELQNLRESHESVLAEKKKNEKELRDAKLKLEDALYSTELSRKESKELKEKLSGTDNLASDFYRLNAAFQTLRSEKYDLSNELSEKNKKLCNLQKSFEELESKNNFLLQKSDQIPILERRLVEIEKACNDLEAQKRSLQINFDAQCKEINNLHSALKSKIEENKHLLDQLTCLQNEHKAIKSDLDDLQNENLSTKRSLAAIRKNSDVLLEKINYYENLERDYKTLHLEHDQIKLENERLQKELDTNLANLNKYRQENSMLQKESLTLIQHSEDLENALVNARTQLIEKNENLEISYLTIQNEIQELNKEKLKNIERIRDLSNQLDVMENIVSDLTQDLCTRDDKIAILENHINKLKDEVARLHGCLTEVIDTGEDIRSTSFDNIDQSLKNMEAHHSKAAHNMKLEVANLQREKLKLEAQMSLTKLKTEESTRESHKSRSQLLQLQNEREIIVTDIKQLELQSIGDSTLSPNHCDVEDILRSLDRIRQYIDEKKSKNNSLEEALKNIQKTSQVLVIEAKDLVEKEKQKILNEKEEVMRDKQYLQNQLDDQKSKLEEQIAHDKNVINDLETEVLNQKLIIGKIEESTASYISKLEEELHSLQILYQNAMSRISELQEKITNLSEQSIKNLGVIDKLKGDLKLKSDEMLELQIDLAKIKNKSTSSCEIQTESVQIKSNTSVQTEKIYLQEVLPAKVPEIKNAQTLNNKTSQDSNLLEILPKQRPHCINEVQILTANVEPIFGFDKSSYLNYKLQRLSIRHLQQQTISNDKESIQENVAEFSESASNNTENFQTEQNVVVNLFKRNSMHTDSSKPGTSNSKTNYRDGRLTSLYDGSELNNSEKETDKDRDIFVIYKESESDFESKLPDDKELFNVNKKSEILEVVSIDSPKGTMKNKINKSKDNDEKSEKEDDDSVKPKLKINLPRVPTDSPSVPTISEGDRKSLDSYSLAINLSPKKTYSDNNIKHGNVEKTNSLETPSLLTISNYEHQYMNSNNSLRVPVFGNRTKLKLKMQFNDDPDGREYSTASEKSVHKLSRVEGDVFLIKSRENQESPKKLNKDYGLQYILDAIKKENEIEFPETINYNDKIIHKIQSDTVFHQGSSTRVLESKNVIKIIPNSWSPSKISDGSRSKSVIDRSVMAKTDSNEDCEAKIRYLTKALEDVEKDCKKKIEAIKVQYDSNIKRIINEHNTGVKSIQNLHEETLQDIIKIHENEVENLRTLSIEAMRRSERLEKENLSLKSKVPDFASALEVEPEKMCCNEGRKRKKSRTETRTLTKTNVEAFNVRPKAKSHGPCTCSLDINLSDTIRNILEQVDIEHRKMAENSYIKYIANKILSTNVEALDAQELSFLHLKVCRIWKMKLNKEEALQKKIYTLEHELMSKQRNAQQHIAELDRKVAKERRRLQEAREAVCRTLPESRSASPTTEPPMFLTPPTPPPTATAEEELLCGCNTGLDDFKIKERRSAGDLVASIPTARSKRTKESNRAVMARLDAEERRDKKPYHDEPPTRLRRTHPVHPADRHRAHKK